MKFSITDFFSKYDQIRSFRRICSHLLKKSLMDDFIFWLVIVKGELTSDTVNYDTKTKAYVPICAVRVTYQKGQSRWKTTTEDLLWQIFNIQSRNVCLSRKILYQYFDVFSPAWGSFTPENTSYEIT